MSVIPAQRFRFLGGEVSPNMYHSADMDKYGRWFSKAENIRFDTLGAFRNRTGFEKIANTKVVNGVISGSLKMVYRFIRMVILPRVYMNFRTI